MPPRLLSLWALAALSLTACATEPASEPRALRVLVKLVRPSVDAQAIARHAGDVAQAPVRYVAATSEQWHALAIECPSDTACEQALARLRADTFSYEHVSVDAQRRVNSR